MPEHRRRGAATAPPGAAGAAADQYSQHFAVVLDGQVLSSPIINFFENPDGSMDARQRSSPASYRSAKQRMRSRHGHCQSCI